jgi:hypothetical protein
VRPCVIFGRTRYCETDVLNTYRVWLIYELFRGAISAEQLTWSEQQVREFVASRKASNQHLCAAVGLEPVYPDSDTPLQPKSTAP